MSEAPHTVSLPRAPVEATQLGYLRFGEVGDAVVITGEAGDFALLSRGEFAELLAGGVDEAHPRHADLAAVGALRHDPDAIARRVRQRRSFLGGGPQRFALVLADAGATADAEIVRHWIDLAFTTPAGTLELELRSDDLDAAWDLLPFALGHAQEKNKYESRVLSFLLSASPSQLSDDRLDWLVARGVRLRARLDGPADLHDAQRDLPELWAPHAVVVERVAALAERLRSAGKDPGLGLDLEAVVTRRSLGRAADIVGAFAELGLDSFGHRVVDEGPQGLDGAAWAAFEEELVVALVARGADAPVDRAVRTRLGRMVGAWADSLRLSSPAACAGRSLLCRPDGVVLPDGGGRDERGPDPELFALGQVGELRWSELRAHPTLRSLAAASLLEALPRCASCWNSPWCGVDPLASYRHGGDLFGQRPLSPRCAGEMAASRALLGRMVGDDDGSLGEIFRHWAGNGSTLGD